MCWTNIIRSPLTLAKHGELRIHQEHIHSDLYYLNQTSLAGANYILTFINDLSRFTWVYFLKKKSHVFEQFKEFWALIEKQCIRAIKCLRYDNGG